MLVRLNGLRIWERHQQHEGLKAPKRRRKRLFSCKGSIFLWVVCRCVRSSGCWSEEAAGVFSVVDGCVVSVLVLVLSFSSFLLTLSHLPASRG